MNFRWKICSCYCALWFFLLLQVALYVALVRSTASDLVYFLSPAVKSKIFDGGQRSLKSFIRQKEIFVTVAYTDVSGAIKMRTINSSALAESWSWKIPDKVSEKEDDTKGRRALYSDPYLTTAVVRKINYLLSLRHVSRRKETRRKTDKGGVENPHSSSNESEKIIRRNNKRLRKLQRIAYLIQQNKDVEIESEKRAIARSLGFFNIFRDTYTVWRKPFKKQRVDRTLKVMQDQIAMAKVYALIARSRKETKLYNSLIQRIQENRRIIWEAHSDDELRDLGPAKSMGELLNVAKSELHDCADVEKKLRIMVQFEEENVIATKKQSSFLTQRAPLAISAFSHRLSLLLTSDYFIKYKNKDINNDDDFQTSKLEDPGLYHYAIFSDNILAASVVVNSTTAHVSEPDKHVFHVVTDGLNFSAMKMWFLVNCPAGTTVQVMNMDEFKWLNSSLSPVLRQLETKRMKEYYFGSDHPSSVSTGDDHLKYRNFKYLSMLNHARFYLPQIYPKLEKIVFLDDDVVVQKDLTPLWGIDLQGKANGAVMTCKDTYHRLNTYLNFSNPEIASSFDPKACGWAFGMNIFDLKAWRKHGVTEIYHKWQEMNWDRRLWKLGTLPPGLIAFYNLTHVLNSSWHVLGLGHESDVQEREIDAAAVIHYNGNYKPWMELAICRFKKYWSRDADGTVILSVDEKIIPSRISND
ncbi:putative galacturonosyltransferase 3 [Wolffia australiana]